MGCAASSGAAPPADAAWAATGALGSDGRAADAPLLRRSRPLPAEPEPEPEPELEPAEPQIALGDLEQLCLLGVGSFGVVSLVRHRHSGKTFALKCCRKDRIVELEQRKHILSERACMARLATPDNPHPFINTLIQTFRQRDKLFFLLDFVQGGELFTVLKKKVRFSDSEARFYAANITLFLEAAHARSVVYRDIKPENVLLDELGYLVVADFGYAKQLSRHSARTYSLCGTPAYLAPEVILHRGHGFEVDWWALGVLLYELVAGYNPFQASISAPATYTNIVQSNAGSMHLPATFPQLLCTMVRALLEVEPSKRLGAMSPGGVGLGGAAAVKAHPWFAAIGPFDFEKMLRRELPTPHQPTWDGPEDVRNFATFTKNDLPPPATEDYRETEPGWDAGF